MYLRTLPRFKYELQNDFSVHVFKHLRGYILKVSYICKLEHFLKVKVALLDVFVLLMNGSIIITNCVLLKLAMGYSGCVTDHSKPLHNNAQRTNPHSKVVRIYKYFSPEIFTRNTRNTYIRFCVTAP